MNNSEQYKKLPLLFFLLLLSSIGYYILTYQVKRENFLYIITLFSVLFAAYLFIYKFFSFSHFKYLLSAGVIFRMLLLFSIPNLSDDVYRFIWDGRLAANGINPFTYVPADIIQMQPVTGITKELLDQLNSPGYFTIYPPVMQGIFWSAGKLFPENIYMAIGFMKLVIITVEIASIFLMIQILKKLGKPKHLSLLYTLNPLVITELSGNVHFEGVMIFFLLLTFLLMLKMQWKSSAVCIGLGIATKLLPVLFIPVIINKLGWKKGIIYTAISGLTALALFAVLLDAKTIQHLLQSIDLFFRHFEFNASIYYIVRWIGAQIKGYNIIAFAGPLLTIIATVTILFISFYKKVTPPILFIKALFIISTWFMFSTTVHPWYICMPVALAVFTRYKYAFVWSFTATFSYAAYQHNPVRENLWLIATGYIIVCLVALWEGKMKTENAYVLK